MNILNWPSPDNYAEWDDWGKALIRGIANAFTTSVQNVGQVTLFINSDVPDGWLELFAAGVHTFNADAYPVLAAKLGGNTLPNITSPSISFKYYIKAA